MLGNMDPSFEIDPRGQKLEILVVAGQVGVPDHHDPGHIRLNRHRMKNGAVVAALAVVEHGLDSKRDVGQAEAKKASEGQFVEFNLFAPAQETGYLLVVWGALMEPLVEVLRQQGKPILFPLLIVCPGEFDSR